MTSHKLDVPGAVLHYEIDGSPESSEPPLLLIGSPMGADGFAALAEHLTDRTIVRYDPRSAGESRRTDGAAETTPDEHADDLHRLIAAVSDGPVDVFASSGGAVNALALVAKHPEQVRTLVAHEPPAAQELPDRDVALATSTAIRETYYRDGFGPAMAKFIELVMLPGPLPGDYAERPAPDPAAFGLPTEDDGARDDALVGHNIVTCTHYRHDWDAIRAASTRVVIGVGETSGATMAARAGVAVAERLGTEPVMFPGSHAGFTGPSEWGPGEEPAAFAVKLREVLSRSA